MTWFLHALLRQFLRRFLPGTLVWALVAGGVSSDFRASRGAEMTVRDSDREHWAYRPLTNPPLPSVVGGAQVRSRVDRFLLARLESNQLGFARRAGPERLVRRIHFDLTGLPPGPEEVDSFAKAYAADPVTAVEGRVDQLLASPHYGERWARHWLDVARYADSDGQESDADRSTAHHYRDFVIQAFNEDLPFDTFVRWQLAGDELEPDDSRAVAATGFLVAGTHAVLPDRLMEEERLRSRFNELDDMISTTGSAMLGLTLACARCHDHKYDPVPRRDYYRMLSAFNGGDRAEIPLATLSEVARARGVESAWRSAYEPVKARQAERVKAARKAHGAAARAAKIRSLDLDEAGKRLLESSPETPEARKLAGKFSKQLEVPDREIRGFLTEEEKVVWDSDVKEMAALELRRPVPLPTALGFADFGPEPRETFLLARGDFRAKSEPVTLGFLTVLTGDRGPTDYWAAAKRTKRRSDSSQQRRAMAEWMTDVHQGAGALVARVMVNRVWYHHFGQGLVRTMNDFGTRSDPPSHPELLEWLASEFVRGGWKLKSLHRLVMTSAAYGQDSSFDETKARMDPANRWLGRRRPRRIEAEILRDAMLAVSGTLDPGMLGPAVKAPIAPEAIQARNMKDPYPGDLKETAAMRRRSIYLFHKRVVQNPLLQAFDGPDAQASCGRRENTTVAPQALALLNDRFVRVRSADFAARLRREAGEGVGEQVRLAWRLAYGRGPSEDEAKAAAGFVRAQVERRRLRGADASEDGIHALALTDFCQALFASNEFIYVD